MDHLEQLENLSIHLLREAYANFKSLGMLWSIGKDSTAGTPRVKLMGFSSDTLAPLITKVRCAAPPRRLLPGC